MVLRTDQVAVRLEEQAKRADVYLQGEMRGRLQEAGYKFLAGCQFLEIKATTEHGNTINGEGFQKFLARRFPHAPYRTIAHRMEFAAKVLARSKEIPGFKHRPLLLGSAYDLSSEQQEAILKMVPDVMDGRGMVEFMQDMKLLKEPELAGGLVATTEQLSKPRKPSAAEIAAAADEFARDRAGWVRDWSADKQLRLAKTKTLQSLVTAAAGLTAQVEKILKQRKPDGAERRKKTKGAK